MKRTVLEVTMHAGPDILLIEDSASQALQLQLILQRAGYRVTLANDGLVGWRAACAQPPRLILLDVDLPALDGFQVLARLKRDPATANIPVVMLTHREHIDHVERAIALGASDYLFKDDGDRLLGAVVAQLLPATEPQDP
jgi:CheY-like chemotaxis protein